MCVFLYIYVSVSLDVHMIAHIHTYTHLWADICVSRDGHRISWNWIYSNWTLTNMGVRDRIPILRENGRHLNWWAISLAPVSVSENLFYTHTHTGIKQISCKTIKGLRTLKTNQQKFGTQVPNNLLDYDRLKSVLSFKKIEHQVKIFPILVAD